jgi:hypothetical protein
LIKSCIGRFFNKDPSKLVRVALTPANTVGVSGDADLYVSNAHDGIVDVTKENCIWKGLNFGCIFIHPDEPNVSRGSHFIVGVFGTTDTTEYELSVTCTSPPPIVNIIDDSRFDFTLGEEYSFFRMVLSPSRDYSGYLSITVAGSEHQSVKTSAATDSEDLLDRSVGSCVYTNDSYPVLVKRDCRKVFLTGKHSDIRAVTVPVIFISGSCLYPTAENYSWKAAGSDGLSKFEIELEEIKHHTDVCYFSVLGCDFSESASAVDRQKIRCVVTTKYHTRARDVSVKVIARRKLFELLYSDIDSETASFSDRSSGLRLDESAFTTGDVDYSSFQDLLRSAGLKDGFTFYDLGAGAGRAVVAVAFSDVQFHRCIGIENLPSLATLGRNVLDRARKYMTSAHSHSHSHSQANQHKADVDGIISSCGFTAALPMIELR